METMETRSSVRNALPLKGIGGCADGGWTFVDAVKSGKVSLENLLGEWRDRFEEDDEKATREVLTLVLQVRICSWNWSLVVDVAWW